MDIDGNVVVFVQEMDKWLIIHFAFLETIDSHVMGFPGWVLGESNQFVHRFGIERDLGEAFVSAAIKTAMPEFVSPALDAKQRVVCIPMHFVRRCSVTG